MLDVIVGLLEFGGIQESSRDIFIKRVEHVRFHSEIDQDSVDRLEAILRDGEIISLSSPGGDFLETVRLTELIRERNGRVETLGECTSGCAIAWVAAQDRLTDGFHAVLFHGSPITVYDFVSTHRSWVTNAEWETIDRHAGIMTRLVTESGIKPWLFRCANRLQGQEHELRGDLSVPLEHRVQSTSRFSLVWFPKSILEAAGIGQLELYGPPNPAQKERAERTYGGRNNPVRIYWAQDGDCDPDIGAATATPYVAYATNPSHAGS